MILNETKKNIKIFTYIIPIMVAFFNLLIILFPKDIISASKEGINLWFNNVLPSLLPFIIGTNLLIGLGFVSFLGTLFEPVMSKIFNVPGCGAFAWILGMTSGYPMGAKITSDLRKSNQITAAEAQRLISFTNNSGPLFVLGAIATSMFNNQYIGYFILLVHLLASITTGLIFRNYKKTKSKKEIYLNTGIIKKSFYNLKYARIKDGRSFGEILSDSVKNAMETIVIIGGFVILFCVLVKSFELINIIDIATNILKPIGNKIGISEDMYKGIIAGIFEMTNGCKFLSENSISPAKIAAITGLISWGGFSIHAQAINFMSKTDIKIGLYLISKIIHSVISVIYTIILLNIFKINITSYQNTTAPAFNGNVAKSLIFSFLQFSVIILLFFMIGIIINLFNSRKHYRNKI